MTTNDANRVPTPTLDAMRAAGLDMATAVCEQRAILAAIPIPVISPPDPCVAELVAKLRRLRAMRGDKAYGEAADAIEREHLIVRRLEMLMRP